jgi:hypothetical protein
LASVCPGAVFAVYDEDVPKLREGGSDRLDLWQIFSVGDNRSCRTMLQPMFKRLRSELREQRQGHRAHLVDGDVGKKRFRTLRQQNADTIAAAAAQLLHSPLRGSFITSRRPIQCKTPSATPVWPPPRPSTECARPSGKVRAERQVAEHAAVERLVTRVKAAVLDMEIGGKKLRFHTGAEVAHLGAGFIKLAERAPADCLVGEIVTQAEVAALLGTT